MSYYGIFLPAEKQTPIDEDAQRNSVFDSRDEAFKAMKKHKESRLKCFKTRDEAMYFSQFGHEKGSGNESSEIKATTPSPIANDANESNTANGNFSLTLVNIRPQPADRGEKSSFRGPTSQALVKFRKCIEQSNYESVEETVWANPRYLIGSGDTPSILKESCRYNALHVSALSKNAKMCKLILDTISNPKFIQLLHGKDDMAIAEEVSQILLDLYLNMPEKGRSETPLHLAAKYGAVEVVGVLTSYKECQMTQNSEGFLPKDVICSRIDSSTEVKNQIRDLLQDKFYVPVLRSVDNSMQPLIGNPYSPTEPPNLMVDPLSPQMEIKAVAGPMNKDQAEIFRKRWKTPPRMTTASMITSPPNPILNGSPLPSYPNHTPIKTKFGLGIGFCSSPKAPKTPTPRRLFGQARNPESPIADAEGNFTFQKPENFGTKKSLFASYRQLSSRFNDSLDDSLLSMNNNSFGESVIDSPGFTERNLKLADVDKGLEVIGRSLAKDQNIGWKEYWSFLDEFIDIGSIEGLTKFENHLQNKLDKANRVKGWLNPPKAVDKILRNAKLRCGVTSSPVGDICRGLNKMNFHQGKEKPPILNNLKPNNETETPKEMADNSNGFHALLCVEKSCQVFAKRLLKLIAHQSSNIVTINDALTCELNRLKSLVCSYKEDIRFCLINFTAAHSRFAHLIVAFLNEEPSVAEGNCFSDFQNTLNQITQAKQNAKNSDSLTASGNKTPLDCLIHFLLERLSDRGHLISPETLTTEQDCVYVWSNEETCDCSWVNDNKPTRTRFSSNSRIERKNRWNAEEMKGQLNNNQYRSNHEMYDSDEEDEDDEYLSLSDSDDENDEQFFTPPESPSNNNFYDAFDPYSSYDNYILGLEPTKMDVDVMKALHGVEIDQAAFPTVFKWHSVLLNHTLEERNNFPSPMVKKRLISEFLETSNFQSNDVPVRPRSILLKPSVLANKFTE